MKIQSSDPDIETIFKRIQSKQYDLQPDFQRDIVWNKQTQQKLIDSILRDWQIPPIHLVEIEGKGKYEVLDGKQRLNAIYSFLLNELKFNGIFPPEKEEFKELNGKYFKDFPDEIKLKINNTSIRIFLVTDVHMNEATELFLRLNMSVKVSESEKRNCIYGPIKNILREILSEYNELFSKEIIGFSNQRMAYQDVLDKILFLEMRNGFTEKPTAKALELMYYEKEIDNKVIQRLRDNLDLLRSIFSAVNFSLTKSTFISYYWFVRDVKIHNSSVNPQHLSYYLNSFEDWIEIQKSISGEENKIHPKYIEFRTFLSEGWLDPSSLQGRHEILMSFYKVFSEIGRLEASDD